MNKYVLIIDDEPRNIFALVAVLKAKKYPCLTAASASEGLEILRSRKDIGIVLMDMMMPEMDGYEAVAHIRKEQTIANTPVIAVTAQAMVGDREKCIDAGVDAYIAKPIDVDVLVSLLKQYYKN